MFSRLSRRHFLAGVAGLAATTALSGSVRAASPKLMRPIPKTGEMIPSVGMGTWITFNVGSSEKLRTQRLEVLKTFFEHGGGMIDTSPMYGSAQDVVGWGLKRLGKWDGLFSADKVWTPAGGTGREQLADMKRLWGLPGLDLVQVHNLVDFEDQMAILGEAKAAGTIRYVGATTSHGSRHAEMARVMKSAPLDFVQFTYNVEDTEAEDRLLPLSADQGLAVIINRPFQRGSLTDALEGEPLPGWSKEIACKTWAQALLKFVISHPAVTCAIPATSQVEHMHENMIAMTGPMPDAALRKRIRQDALTLV